MSVRRAQEEIDSAEFTEWMAYYQLEPFGEERADLRAAIIASTIANAFSKKRSKPQDFMPQFEREVVAKSPKQIENLFKSKMPKKRNG